jgi:hypothetical protein
MWRVSARTSLGAGLALAGAAAALVSGCGSGSGAPPAATRSAASSPVTSSGTSGGSRSSAPAATPALTGEAQSAAAGDIPDNQAFLTFRNRAAAYSMKYPEGWARRGAGRTVTFRDKNNVVRISVATGGAATVAGAATEMARLRGSTPSLRFQRPAVLALGGRRLVKVVYTTQSATNPVTGKRVQLTVDRYYVPGAGRHAVVDLGTPVGVDNVDAYRLMIESFRWR